MRRFVLCATLLVVATEALGEGQPPRPPKLSPGAGVTPGGFLFNVIPSTSRLKVYGLDGGTRAAYVVQPGEGHVLGVADSGARVTSVSTGGVRQRMTTSFEEKRGPGAARLVFRDPSGNILATREPEILAGSSVEVRGDEAYYVRRVGPDYVVFRASAAELETAVIKVPADRIRHKTGRVDSVTLHASSAGLVAEFHGPYSSVYADVSNPGRLLVPDATVACGGSRYSPVWPVAGGGIARISPGSAAARLETFDAGGLMTSMTDLQPASTFAVLPDGSLLAMRNGEMFVLDDRGREISHVVLAPDDEGLLVALPGTGGSSPLREGATGAEWAEAAIKARAPLGSELVAARDPEGVVRRFARVLDGVHGVESSRTALRLFFDSRGFAYQLERRSHTRGVPPVPTDVQSVSGPGDRWDGILKIASSLAEPDGPSWFRRETARALLAAGPDKAPAWALETVIGAVSSGLDSESVGLLPEAAFTPALAEIVSATERARLDRLGPAPAFDEAELESEFDYGAMNEFAAALYNRELHVPAMRFPALVLSCGSGATPQRLEAVARALLQPSPGLWWAGAPDLELDVDEPPPAEPLGSDATQAQAVTQERYAVAAGQIGSLLGAALHSDDPDERALAQALAPAYGLSIDVVAYRRDVLTRPGLDTTAVPLLLIDRTLGSAEWTRLMADALASIRSRAADPVACVTSPMGAMQDRYCLTLLEVFAPLMYRGLVPGTPLISRQAEILALAHSPKAPPEVRLQGKLTSVLAGSATTAEFVDVWREESLPRYIRQAALRGLSGSAPGSAPPGGPAALEHELREGHLDPEDSSALLGALATADPAAARRLALEHWEKGDVPLEGGERDDHAASPWIASLDPQDATASPGVHAALKRLLEDEKNGPAASALLSKAGDPDALPAVIEAARTGCLA